MYHLIYSTDLEKDYSQWRFKPEASNYTVVEGLKPFTTYYFRMVAYTRVGRGPPTEMFVVKTGKGAPGPAENVAVTVLSPTSIQVTWQPPHYSGSGIFGYKIHYNKSSSEMDETIDVMDTVLGYVIRNLRPNRHYKVQVAVKSDVHIGPLSFAKVVQTLEAAPSAAPMNIQGKALSSTSLLISWDPPPLDHRNGPITNYTVKYRIKGERACFVNVDGAKTSIRLHHLRKYTTYLLWVSASTSVGEGPMSEKHSYTTAEDVPSGAPRQPSATVVNSSAIVVRWCPPLQKDQAGRLEGYVVYYLKVDDLGNQLYPRPDLQIDHTARGDLAIVLTGLQPDQTYQIRVAALTRKGDGPQSNPVLAKTKPKLPNPPHVYNMPSSSPSEVIIRWKTVARDILSFKLRYAKSLQRMRAGDQANLKMKEMTFLPRTSNHIFKGLDPGVWYLFKVSTETKVGWSPERSLWVQIPPGPPSGPPLEVRASAHSSTRVRVTWKEPDEWKRNGPLAGYSVVYNPLYRRVKALVKNVTNPNHTRTMLTNLKMFTDYEIRVRALGVKGPGPLSPSVVIKTKEGLPGPPRDLEAEARSTDSLTVSWNSPQFPNGRVLGYYVVYSDDQSLPVSQWSGTEPSGYNAKIKALERDKTYWIRVAARTSKGQGDYSLPVSAKTLKYDCK
ncbi:tyrosine-protein phosphatase Lar-like [Porites lutea]|uniref:tyrosine-protein phosphatase Lar-like n=1 Tax=Porites lutea TaxID=51062 RepID=UPI003CC691B6